MAKKTLREKIADTVDVSKEAILDCVMISVIGTREMTLENYQNILAYHENCIRVKAKPHPVCIRGKQLELGTITRDFLYITGSIEEICFEE